MLSASLNKTFPSFLPCVTQLCKQPPTLLKRLFFNRYVSRFNFFLNSSLTQFNYSQSGRTTPRGIPLATKIKLRRGRTRGSPASCTRRRPASPPGSRSRSLFSTRGRRRWGTGWVWPGPRTTRTVWSEWEPFLSTLMVGSIELNF